VRILFVLPKLSGGGAENIGAQLATALSERHKVLLVCLQESVPPEYPIGSRVRRITLNGALVQRLRLLPWLRRLNHGDLTCHVLRAIKRLWRPRTSVSFLEDANTFNVASSTGERTIISIRNNYSTKFSEKTEANALYLEQARTTAQNASHVVAISEYVRYDQIGNFGADSKNTSVIYNPCDALALQTRAAEPLPSTDCPWAIGQTPMVVSVGRLVPQKGQWHLVRAFRSVVAHVPNARLLVLGRGPLQQQLQDLVDACGLHDRVYLAGYHANPFPFLARAQVFAFPSIYEGLGNAVLEAMACGLPIASTDCAGGPRELLAPGTGMPNQATGVELQEYGLLCPTLPDDSALLQETQAMLSPNSLEEEQLADALMMLLKDDELRDHYAKQSLQRIKDFDPSRIFAQWEQVIAG
jgi:N-acetylgalactosamine-N,N'-diacetylbacillosaminyl-diphospho-undecaprenol 4-alpha-N-acetylgalactosaminyltransferase